MKIALVTILIIVSLFLLITAFILSNATRFKWCSIMYTMIFDKPVYSVYKEAIKSKVVLYKSHDDYYDDLITNYNHNDTDMGFCLYPVDYNVYGLFYNGECVMSRFYYPLIKSLIKRAEVYEHC